MTLLLSLLAIILLFGAPRVLMVQTAKTKIHALEDAPSTRVAVVFGAGLTASGSPTRVLKDRVETAVLLYQSGSVEKILMSGDNRYLDYNEPGAMKNYALEFGIPEEDIIQDFAGRRTYDTCYRARDIFQIDQITLVTQHFHLPRALYTCQALGLSAEGVASDLRMYRDAPYWNIREIPACLIAFIQVHLTKPEPVLGDPEPIFPME